MALVGAGGEVHDRLGAGGLVVGTLALLLLGLLGLAAGLGGLLLLLVAAAAGLRAAGNYLLRTLLGPRTVPVVGLAKISLALRTVL